jgi:hypothetical protein
LSFILKFVLVLLIFSFVVYVLKAIARLSFSLRGALREVRQMREQLSGREASAEMVRCAACGAFVAARDALRLSSRGRAETFCSHECIQAYAKSA